MNHQSTHTNTRGRRRSAPWLLGGLVLMLLALLIIFQVAGLRSILPSDTASDTLLLYALSTFTFIAFILFAFILVRSILKLRRERRAVQVGSKLKTRLLVYFLAVSLLPITAMAVFSYLFLNRSLEKWFSAIPEEVMSEAKGIQARAITERAWNLKQQAATIAALLDQQPPAALTTASLAPLVQRGDLVLVEIVAPDGAVIARSQKILEPADERDLDQTVAIALRTRGDDFKLQDSVAYDVALAGMNDGNLLLIAPARRNNEAVSEVISTSPTEFDKLKQSQRKVRQLGLSVLAVLTLLLIFAATWIAFHTARGLALPIQALAEASREVARGNFSYRVDTPAEDELALLADSFNQMTSQLDQNRQSLEANATELRDKNIALEEQRNYVQTVLESVSAGVISLDEGDRVTTINAAAAAMLHVTNESAQSSELSQVVSSVDLAALQRLLQRARRIGYSAEQLEITRAATAQHPTFPAALSAAALPDSTGRGQGVVLVIEDLSELLAAQRAAAWSEVARRMAHEIKNPLTPIQLSAERIAKTLHRLLGGEAAVAVAHRRHEPLLQGMTGPASYLLGKPAAAADVKAFAAVVDECTATITREVAGLKAMVDEFSRFARLPASQPKGDDLNEIVRQAVMLYQDRLNGVRLDVHLAHTLPQAQLDADQLRRVFVNLIDNALEAMTETDGEKRITIATAHDPARARLLVEVADTGPGITRADFPLLFQPYFSTKGRGTGLGLAIVQRIIGEHGGRIRTETNYPTGAKFVIELPLDRSSA